MNYISEDIFPKNYKHLDVENKIIKEWDKENLYSNFNPDSKKKIFSVDTPPPTASGYLHIGHVFSYSHQDFIVRFRRMRGVRGPQEMFAVCYLLTMSIWFGSTLMLLL